MNENEFQTIYELCSEIQDECDRETPNLETIKIHAAAIPEYLNEILNGVRHASDLADTLNTDIQKVRDLADELDTNVQKLREEIKSVGGG